MTAGDVLGDELVPRHNRGAAFGVCLQPLLATATELNRGVECLTKLR